MDLGERNMDDGILKEWAELSTLALKLNDSDKFPVSLDMAGHVESFVLRVGRRDAKYFQLQYSTESSDISSLVAFSVSNIKAAKEWLTARHGDMLSFDINVDRLTK